MQQANIVIEGLNKFYGSKKALSDLNLTIEEGMFGLLGRNGAGKTTLMRTMATLLKKQSGKISVCGIKIEKASEVRSIIGYLPQDFSMYPEMTVLDSLDYLGVLSCMGKTERRKRISEILNQVNLSSHRYKKVRALSGGMKQRLGIAQALIHDPKVLIVDEPTAGLDPEERVRFRNLLCEVAENKIVILSTHIVGDIEATCEKIAILNEGVLIFSGTVAELCRKAEGYVYVAEIAQADLVKFKSSYTITSTLSKGNMCSVRFLADHAPAIGVLETPNIEDAYIHCLNDSGKYKKAGRY